MREIQNERFLCRIPNDPHKLENARRVAHFPLFWYDPHPLSIIPLARSVIDNYPHGLPHNFTYGSKLLQVLSVHFSNAEVLHLS